MYKDTLEIVIKNNCLALKIPGQNTYEFRPPDKNGKWYFRVSNVGAVSFKETEAGKIEAFTYYEAGAQLIYKRVQATDKKRPA